MTNKILGTLQLIGHPTENVRLMPHNITDRIEAALVHILEHDTAARRVTALVHIDNKVVLVDKRRDRGLTENTGLCEAILAMADEDIVNKREKIVWEKSNANILKDAETAPNAIRKTKEWVRDTIVIESE